MRFILLLLPNLYDFFTLLMIGYAFFLHHNSKLQIPFGIACLLIYATTRIGIFAGKIINLMLNRGGASEEGIEEPADVVAKKMIMGIFPQCIFIIICQVIFALFFLNNQDVVKSIMPDKANSQQQEQVQSNNETAVNDEIQGESKVKSVESNSSASFDEDYDEEDEEVVPAVPQKPAAKPVAKTSVKTVSSKRRIADKKTETKKASSSTVTTAAKPNVYYEIPDRTLRTAGISPASRRIGYAQAAAASGSVVPAASNTTNWTFSAANTNERIAQNVPEQLKQAPASALKPKRYPGDDNPLNTNWGYYKYTDKPVSQTQSQSAAPANRTYTIPANTLRSIGN